MGRMGTQTSTTCQSCQRTPRSRSSKALHYKIKQEAVRHFSEMLRDRCKGIPAQTINNLVKVFGAADLINAVVASDIHTVHLPDMKLTAGVIPVPDLERFNPKLPFGGSTSHTWGLVHGTTLTGATAILIEGFIRPADWAHDGDPKKSQLPTFGLCSVGQQISRGDTELPRWVEQTLLHGQGIQTWKRSATPPGGSAVSRKPRTRGIEGTGQRHGPAQGGKAWNSHVE